MDITPCRHLWKKPSKSTTEHNLNQSESQILFNYRICGRVNTVPAFRWYVEHEQPENVTITLRHIGLNDGYSEGLSFNLFGESNVTNYL